MQFPSITVLTAGLMGLLFMILAFRVVRIRLATKTSLGDGAGTISMGDERNAPPLFVATRTHANFCEYVPLSLVLLLCIEVVGAPRWAVGALAATLVLARVLHPIGMVRPTPNLFRAGGILLQWIVLLVGSVYAAAVGAMLLQA